MGIDRERRFPEGEQVQREPANAGKKKSKSPVRRRTVWTGIETDWSQNGDWYRHRPRKSPDELTERPEER